MVVMLGAKFCNGIVTKLRLLFIVCLLPVVFTVAQTDREKNRDYILVINTYTEGSAWSNYWLSQATDYVRESSNLSIYAEHMNMLDVKDSVALEKLSKGIFAKYSAHPPRILLLLGNSPLMMLDDFRANWGDIPIVLCAERDYTGPKEAYLKKQVIPVADRISIASLAQANNMTFLYADLFVPKNVKMMFRMIPGMKKFIFIGDQRYVNQENDAEIQEVLAKNYPQVEYQFFSPKDMSVNQLLDSLNSIDPKTTGVLFGSWFFKPTMEEGNTSLVTNSYRIIATTSAPLFALKMDAMDDEAGMLGGYSYDGDHFKEVLTQTLKAIINGKQARDIPFYLPSDGEPVFNYKVMLQKDMPLSLCPADTLFINKPPTFWEQYKYVVWILIFIFITAFFLYRMYMFDRYKRLQQKEIETMAKYKNLIGCMPIIYMQEEVVRNEAGAVVDLIYRNVNTTFEKYFLPKEKVIDRKASEVFPESLFEFLPFIQVALSENKTITFPYYSKRIDTFYDVVLSRTNADDVIDVFCLDSTELHKAQQKLSSTNNKLAMALDVASIVPWKWDLTNKTILCDINRPIELSMEGGDVTEEQLAVPDDQYFQKIFKEDRERVRQAYQDLLEGRSEKVKEEYRVVSIENHIHKIEWVEAQAAVEKRDENGKPLALVGSSLIITNRKKMELELITAKDRAEESNRLKSAFLANMSHEIRTPLNAIVGFSGILASTEEEQEKQEYVNIIENNNTLLLQLISDILDLSKIEAGALEFTYSNIELNHLLKDLRDTLQLRIKTDAVQLEFVSPMEVCHVRTEKNRISQLFINLVTNAIKFTMEGSIRFGYELHGKELYCYVSDTGIGIPKDKQENIFGRFVKLNSFAQGTGLGLSICHTLVEHMGGHIGVESEEGHGSTFWFTLPYEEAMTVEETPEPQYQPIVVEKDKLTILIAEDNDSNYKLFMSVLKNDYKLIHAWDGREAVEMFKTYEPQMILMDINMPVMDGYEATKEIRKYSARVPIIAITAFAYASDEQRVMESGFDGYMPKPINARLLKTQIGSIMKKRILLL
ncbi:uncharacterized protein BN604_00946 [Bacteroides intestinalis CAG:315]|jgi:signal transduction histidine kinase|nr:uncharacterized protein BN604_00946 [Bacteroides intestinalis CAG:315]